MAIFHLDIKPVTRSTGRSATSAAAYRAGESIRDERTGNLYNHANRQDVLHKEILLPTTLEGAGAGLDWARDRSTLWNTAERTERQSNSRVAREYLAALPAELPAQQRVALARTFAREIADRYNVAVDLAVHEPRPAGDPRNFHAHLLATTREVTAQGLGAKTGVDMAGGVRSELGLPPSRQEFVTLRARWAQLTNEALRQANIEARVDHRSLAAQGIDREPRPSLPIAAIATERRGQRSEVAERIRARYRARVAAREQRALAPPADRPRAQAGPAQPQARDAAPRPLDMQARRRQAVQDWLKYRAEQAQPAGPGERAPPAPAQTAEEIRRQAVQAWKRLQARGAESPPARPEPSRDRRSQRQAQQPGPERDAPGLGGDFPE
jgi:MobA/MobL family